MGHIFVEYLRNIKAYIDNASGFFTLISRRSYNRVYKLMTISQK